MPTVLTPSEANAIIQRMSGVYQVLIQLLYSSGLRLNEGLRLRVKDIDFSQHQFAIRDAKGRESRVTMLPTRATPALQTQLQQVKRRHQQDLNQGYGDAFLPFALARKYPNAAREWRWQFVFPSRRR
ncbi:MAG: tyrosine-type recombinase/integrase [Cyanobacteria bacterium P01_F01_bin.86]